MKTSIISKQQAVPRFQATVEAVIFDLDGVLIDTEYVSFQVWSQVAAEYGGQLSHEIYPGMIGLTAEETGEYVMRAGRVRFNLTETVARVWKTVTGRIEAGVEPMAGAEPLIRDLAGRGYPLAIASNSPTGYIHKALSGLKLQAYFHEIAGINEVAEGKPAPDVYLLAARRLGVSPERCLAIEDSYVGSQAALKAGMRVLAVPAPQDERAKFSACFGVYDSLVHIHAGLEEVIR